MARKTARPGRTLVVFFAGLALPTAWWPSAAPGSPRSGLDLQGGTRITLIAKGSPRPRASTRPRGIIDQRVNGSGVSEAEVTTQGNQFVVVEIPGKSRRDLVDTVKRQAQLRFRLVACDSQSAACGGQPAPGAGGDPAQRLAQRAPAACPARSPAASPRASRRPRPSASPKNRAPLLAAKPRKKASPTKAGEPLAEPLRCGVGQPLAQPLGRPELHRPATRPPSS